MSSYVLDDILNSARLTRTVPVCGTARVTETTSSHFINANSNQALLGSNSYTRVLNSGADNEFRKQLADLSDQLKMYKIDTEKKGSTYQRVV